MKIWCILLALCAGCRAVSSNRVDAPAIDDASLPDVPPVEKEIGPPPKDGAIERNGVLVDRFSVEGQRVRYAFDMDEGELTIFDLGCFGNARLWHSTARIRVLDPEGRELEALEREGPVVHHEITSFVAPKSGRYTYEIAAARSIFRYRLLRHSGIADRELGSVESLGDRRELVGYLKSSDDCAHYSLDVNAGDEIALRVLNRDEEGKVERRTLKPRRMQDGVYDGMLYPGFELDVRDGGRAIAERGHFVLAHFEHATRLSVDVRTHTRGDGGLFVLSIERNAPKIVVRGSVRDANDAPLEGVALSFVLDPERDPWAAARSNADGTFEVALPRGAYQIALSRDLGTETVALNLLEARELNLIFDHPVSAAATAVEEMRRMTR